ncbi:MAG: phosphohistidine phosphatase [Gammaproteobacteria bacterium HGW-Gammaproteobacteria-15]|nr:MAG: phosphohistidine phosphatase [Gammaproteobacteria bacterium HGW-Gammaproteobacteria-15]
MDKYLYFLRHATAEVIRPNQLDIDRCLIEKGRLQARRVAAFMQRHGIVAEAVLSSPYPRAVQTAAIVCKEAGFAAASEQSWLALETPTDVAYARLIEQLATLPVHSLLVGHEPDFSALISRLLDSDKLLLNIRKSSLTCIGFCSESGSFELQWSVPARFM